MCVMLITGRTERKAREVSALRYRIFILAVFTMPVWRRRHGKQYSA